MEWQLFKAAVASSAARACGRKRLGVANHGKKGGGNRRRKMLLEQKILAWRWDKVVSSSHLRCDKA